MVNKTRKPFKMVFRNKHKLDSMLSLRKMGWTYMSLALLYGVDYTSIYHECKKFNVKKEKDSVDFSVRSILNDLGIHAKKEKTYADYLREAGYKSQMNWDDISV